MIFIINGERWVSLIEAVRRATELQIHTPITYAPDLDKKQKYYDFLLSYPFQQLPWDGSLYLEMSN